MDMKFGTWYVRSLYRAGTLKTVASEMAAKCNLDVVAMQEVRWMEGGSQPSDGNGNANHYLGTGLFMMRSFITSTLHRILLGVIKSRRIRWAGHVARMGEMRITYNILTENLERKRPLRRPRSKWEDNIGKNLRESLGRCGLDTSDSE
jgi:hypothetical protein